MALFMFDNHVTSALPLQPIQIEDNGIKEEHIRDLLAKQLQALDEETKIMFIAREYGSWEDSNRRIDILAIEPTDEGGRLVVIELKREKNGGHAELQALRYAAMVATHTFSDLVSALTWERNKSDSSFSKDQAEKELISFLGKSAAEEVKLSEAPRIVLVAPSFSKEITTTVLWLMQHTLLEIACYTVTLYSISGTTKALHFDKLLPLEEQEDHLIKVRAKLVQEAEQEKVKAHRMAKATSILEKHGILKDDDQLLLIEPPRANMHLVDIEKKATYKSGGRVVWQNDHKEYSSLSALTGHICELKGYKSVSVAGPRYWGKENGGPSLYEMAQNFDSNQTAHQV